MVCAPVSTADDGYEVVDRTVDCALMTGPEVAPGLPSFRARCHWPEVPAGALSSLLDRVERHPELFWMVTEVTVLDTLGDGSLLVHQRQEVAPVKARETTVRIERSPTGAGGTAWSWSQAPPVVVDPKAVQAPLNQGAWVVDPDGQGGALLTFDLAYDPGGEVPRWLVRWCQASGAGRMLGDLRLAAAERVQLARRQG